MKVSDAYPSKWLKSDDVGDRTIAATIADVRQEEVGDQLKLVAYFEGSTKGMVLNRTNADSIKDLYGDDTEDWVGERIALYTTMVNFQGKSTKSIRVRAAKEKIPAKSPAKAKQHTEDNPPPVDGVPDFGEELNDEIAF